MKRSAFALLLAGLVFSDLAQAATPSAAEDARFKRIWRQEWAWRQAQGLVDDEDDDRVPEFGLPKVDAASQARRTAVWTRVKQGLDRIDRAKLSAPEQVNFLVYRGQIEALLAQQHFRDYEKPLNSDTAFWSGITGDARKTYLRRHDYALYLAELRDVPRYFDDQIANMRAGLARGFTPPKVTLIGRDGTIAAVSEESDPDRNVLFTPFLSLPQTLPEADRKALRDEARGLIRDQVLPAYRRLLDFVRNDYVPHAQQALAAERLPDGKAYYRSKINEFTTTDLSADEIHRIGLEEVAKIHVEMLAVMEKTGFTGGLPAFLEFLRTDPQFYAKSPEELLMRAAFIAKKVDGKISQFFGYLPRRRFAIEPVPADQAPFYTSGRGGPGLYQLNTWNLPARPLYSLPALTLHESAPGHAFQMPIASEQKGTPPFRNAYISAYGEGWALYCERLGSEMGIYETPWETFGMLSYQAWRAARLVVDTGIHNQGWTREQAQAYLHDNTALAQHEIETEVDRYIAWPGQALSYYLGELAIFKARHKAEAALGEKFDIRAFHDTVLQLGSVPLPVLQDRIDRFIREGGKSPYPPGG